MRKIIGNIVYRLLRTLIYFFNAFMHNRLQKNSFYWNGALYTISLIEWMKFIWQKLCQFWSKERIYKTKEENNSFTNLLMSERASSEFILGLLNDRIFLVKCSERFHWKILLKPDCYVKFWWFYILFSN